jgi:hypothetical protein
MRIPLLTILTATLLIGGPALQEPKAFKHDDGSSFQGKLQGDEWFHWVETANGHAVKYNPQSRDYEYLEIREENNETVHGFTGVRVPADVNGVSQAAPEGIEQMSKEKLGKAWKSARKKRHGSNGLDKGLRD